MNIFILFIFQKIIKAYSVEKQIIEDANETEICFYSKKKYLCPSKIKSPFIINPNDLNSPVNYEFQNNVKINIVENIILTHPLEFPSPITYFIKGKMISGVIELGNQTIVDIENPMQIDFILNYSVKMQKISKLITNKKAKSAFIRIFDCSNNLKNNISLLFYKGKKTEISFSENSNEEINFKKIFSINQKNSCYYINYNINKIIKKQISKIQGKCGDNLRYSFDDNKLTISGNGNMYDYDTDGELSPPWSSFISSIYSIEIEDGVTSIGSNSFNNCNKLNKINIGRNVDIISDSSFKNCNSLTTLFIPGNVKEIKQNSFEKCNLENLEIEEGLEIIGENAFKECNIKILKIPESVKIIDSYAFYFCKFLVTAIPNNVQYIGKFAFTFTDIEYAKIPEGVTVINENTFSSCFYLSTVILPESLIEIHMYSFHEAPIKNITIPKNVRKIEYGAFPSGLQNIILLSDNIDIQHGAFISLANVVNFFYTGVKEVEYYTGFESVKNFYVPMDYEGDFCSGKKVTKLENVLFDSFKCKIFHPKCNKCDDNGCLECDQYWTANKGTCDVSCAFNCLHCVAPYKCTICDDKYYNDEGTCRINCHKIDPHCEQCYTTDECNKCEYGYTNYNHNCYLSCKTFDSSCVSCDRPFNCLLCENGFLPADDFCWLTNETKKPFNNHTKYDPPFINTFYLNLLNNYFNIIDSSLELIPEKIDLPVNYSNYLYVIDLPIHFNKVTIPETDELIEVKLNQNENIVTFDVEKSSSKFTINCLNGGKIIIPSDHILNIKGKDKIEINTNQYSETITIQKVTLEAPNSKTLISSKSNLKINEMQVFYEQKFDGQVSSIKTSCDLLKVERGAKLEPSKISFDIVKIGLYSNLNILDDSVDIKHYKIYYSIPQFLFNVIPITFHYPFPDFSNSDFEIEIFDLDTSYLDSEEQFIIASFAGDDKTINKNACESIKLNKSIEFERYECKPMEDEINYELIAYKINRDIIVNEEDKITIGAIFGFVFDGIVFLLLIIMVILLIVFKIKRKRDSQSEDENT